MKPLDIYKGKTVLITGHTGFKGSWLSIWLKELGANVIGFSLEKSDNDYIFRTSGLSNKIVDERGDIRSNSRFKEVIERHKPEIIFHLAAQPLVRKSYRLPKKTFQTNIIGTLNVLDAIRKYDFLNAGVIITTDKCYKNKEFSKGYSEDDELGGHDPYSASKACAELLFSSYNDSFFRTNKYVASARAGNVIGGGDFSEDRLVVDCVNYLKGNNVIKIRNPISVRPWQYVLEPLYGYLLLGSKLLERDIEFCSSWNFGPSSDSIVPVSKIADLIVKYWGDGSWIDAHNPNEVLHETSILSLNIDKAKKILGWKPKINIETAVQLTIEWYKNSATDDVYRLCVDQINKYYDLLLLS